MRLTVTGDALITRRIPEFNDPEFRGMRDLIRGCDVAFTNTEVVLSRFRGSPVVESGGMALSVDPRCAHDLRALGFNCTAFANNHTLNYGEEGVLLTLEALREADLVCAGAGATLGEARVPAYIETPRGRVGLVACASTFTPSQRAGDQTPFLPGRPGLNPLRFKRTLLLDEAAMGEFKRVAETTGIAKAHEWRRWMGFAGAPLAEGDYEFLDLKVRLAPAGEPMRFVTEPHPGDTAEIGKWTAEAKRQAGFALVSIHAHEQRPEGEHWEPADFLPTFAHAMVDAGADLFVGHGPHMLRGLEIYKGKPIFYSVGNFIFQHETMERVGADDFDNLHADPASTPGQVLAGLHGGNLERSFPAVDRYWETVLPLCDYDGDQLRAITLYPLTLGYKRPVWERGTPRLARGATARATLQRFAELSEPFGTRITIDSSGEVGRVALG